MHVGVCIYDVYVWCLHVVRVHVRVVSVRACTVCVSVWDVCRWYFVHVYE